jgi:hypothetical protein
LNTTRLLALIGGRAASTSGRLRREGCRPSAESLESRLLLASTLTAKGVTLSEKYDKSFSADIATFTSTIKNENLKKFHATIAWGDGTTSVGTVVKDGSNKFAVTGKHTYKDPLNKESVVTTITDNSNAATASATSSLKIIGGSVTASPVSISAVEGDVIAGPVVVATFSVGKVKGAASPIPEGATIVWGPPDGGGINMSAGTIVPTSVPGQYEVMGSHIFQENTEDTNAQDEAAGIVPPISVMVTVHLGLGKSGALSFVVESPLFVADAPITTATAYAPSPTQSVSFNHTATINLADFIDHNIYENDSLARDYTIQVDWGDPSGVIQTTGDLAVADTPLNLNFQVQGGLGEGITGYFNLTGYHTYLQSGTYDVKVTILDNGLVAYTTSDTVTATSDAMLQGVPEMFFVYRTPPPSSPVTHPNGPPTRDAIDDLAYFTAPTGATSLNGYTITVNYGDGFVDTDPELAMLNIPGFTPMVAIVATHTYAMGGGIDDPIDKTITVTVTGPGIDPSKPLTSTTTAIIYQNNA